MVEADHTIKLICIFYKAILFGIALELVEKSVINLPSHQSFNHLFKQKPSKRQSWKLHQISQQCITKISTIYHRDYYTVTTPQSFKSFLITFSLLCSNVLIAFASQMTNKESAQTKLLIFLSRSYFCVWISMPLHNSWNLICLLNWSHQKMPQKQVIPQPACPPVPRVVGNLSKPLLSESSNAVFSVKPLF